jgi:hypothetical protein
MNQLEGAMDGMSLSLLIPGVVYEVTVSIGTWLVCQGVAEEEVSLVVPVVLPAYAPSAALATGVTVARTKDRKDGSKS